MSINTARLMESFSVMGLGMLGIFIVMGILFVVSVGVSRINKRDKS